MIQIQNFVKDPRELEDCQAVMKEHYAMMKGIFKHYSAMTQGLSIFDTQWNMFTEFAHHCKV